MGRGTLGLEDAIAAVVREAALLGATVTITMNPALPIPPAWNPKEGRMATGHLSEAEVEELDPPEIEGDLITYLVDALGEQLTLPQFAKLLGMTSGQARGFFRRASCRPDSVKNWLFTQFDTVVEDDRKFRTYRLTDAGRKIVLSKAWQSRVIYTTDTE